MRTSLSVLPNHYVLKRDIIVFWQWRWWMEALACGIECKATISPLLESTDYSWYYGDHAWGWNVGNRLQITIVCFSCNARIVETHENMLPGSCRRVSQKQKMPINCDSATNFPFHHFELRQAAKQLSLFVWKQAPIPDAQSAMTIRNQPWSQFNCAKGCRQ